MVPIEKIFLRDNKTEERPWNQRESSFYQKVRDSIKKCGKMINPLICTETDERKGKQYKCYIGNNRWLAALELGHKEVPIKIITDPSDKNLMAEVMKYIPIDIELQKKNV
tara:strand:- start:277 stop:606 length:330 start_codon:yes stop_codon:yes gene_type:complete